MAVVVSQGRLEGTGSAFYAPMIPSGLNLYTERFSSYEQVYRSQPALRTVVRFIASAIAQLGLKTYRRLGDTEREHLADHPLARTIRRPNPYTTRYSLLYDLVSDLCIFDSVFFIKLAPSSDPDDLMLLQRVPPAWVQLVGGNWIRPDLYRITMNGRQQDFRRDEIVHIHGFNPSDVRTGVSPIETLRRVLAEDEAAGEFREQFWANHARHSGMLAMPEGMKLSDAARARIKADWQAKTTGTGPDAGGTVLLEEGLTFVPAQQSARDAQYIEARKLTREEAAAAYGVPPPMVGLLDNANYSNVEGFHRFLYQDTLAPWLKMIQEEFELQLLPEFTDTDRVYLEFNLREKLEGSFEEQTKSFQTAVGGPVMTRNEARARLNLPPIEGGDVLIVPMNVTEGGLASPTDTAPPPKALDTDGLTAGDLTLIREIKAESAALTKEFEEDQLPPRPDRDGQVAAWEKALIDFADRQERVVKSKIGAKSKAHVKAALEDVWDEDRWNDELSRDLEAAATGTALAYSQGVADQFGIDPPVDGMSAWLANNSRIAAEGINGDRAERLRGALVADDVDSALTDLFGLAKGTQAQRTARSQVTTVGNFARHDTGRFAGAESKTWVQVSGNPRSLHVPLNGKTVALSEDFGNGMAWPGDPAGGPENLSHCQCLLELQ